MIRRLASEMRVQSERSRYCRGRLWWCREEADGEDGEEDRMALTDAQPAGNINA